MADRPTDPPVPTGDPAPEPGDDPPVVIPGRDATPSVLAVVVAHDPGGWFDETLESLATQDYPRLDVLVVDTVGDAGLDTRVRAALPDASVLDAADTSGFSPAADAVLDTDLDPAFVLICHDDVALAPDAVRLLVTEALRSNAGIAGPKLVDWARPDRLQHVGLLVDRFAASAEVVEADELDQEQYDAVGDVFAVPSACVLVRADLFADLGGFDPVITARGEDVDLCWRAQLLGARVLVVPDAVVRHRQMMVDRTGVDDIRKLRARHQLRTVLVASSLPALLVTLPVAALLSLGEALIALLTGRFAQVGHVLGAWTWNLRRLSDVLRRRRAVRARSRARGSDIRALQQAGSVRINAFVRGQIGRGGGLGGAGRDLFSAMRTGTTRTAALTWALVVAFVIFGSRALLSDGVPAVGDYAAFPDRAGDLVSAWWNGWHDRDVGSPGTVPSGVGVLGVLGWVSGALGLVRTLWVLLPLVLGLLGAWRLLAVSGSRRAQIGSLVAYLVIPLPWTGLAEASIAGLVAYAVAPWVLLGLLRAEALVPFRRSAGPVFGMGRAVAGLGAVIAVALVFEPGVVMVLPITAAGLLAGGVLAARPVGGPRVLVATVAAAVVAAVLALPLVVDLLVTAPTWDVLADGRDGTASSLSLERIVRFETGAADRGPLLWLLAVPLALPLLVGRAWRFELAVRCWAVALAGWGTTWAVAWGVVPVGLPDPEVLLAPAAAGVAGIAGTTVISIEHDFRAAGFGWRQGFVALALVAAVVASAPLVGALESGRWNIPPGDYAEVLPLADAESEGSYRVLWIGDPRVLPAAGRSLEAGMAWTATLDGLPTLVDRHVPADDGRAGLVEEAVREALDGETARLGRVLGGLGIRYVVLVERLAPAPFTPVEQAVPVPEVLVDAFADQLDLQRLEGVNSAVRLFANTEWTSVRAALVPGFDEGVDDIFDLSVRPLAGSGAVLAGGGTSLEGAVPPGTEILVAQTPDARWRLEVEGSAAARRRAIGWADAFLPASGGEATLDYSPPWWRRLAIGAQLLAFAVFAAAGLRRIVWGARS